MSSARLTLDITTSLDGFVAGPNQTLEQPQGGTTFTFVTEGIGAALEQAAAAAGDRDVALAGGGSVVQQYLRAGLLDELQIHVAPLLLGGGVQLFDRLGVEPIALETTRVIASPTVTQLKFRVVKEAA